MYVTSTLQVFYVFFVGLSSDTVTMFSKIYIIMKDFFFLRKGFFLIIIKVHLVRFKPSYCDRKYFFLFFFYRKDVK